MIAIMVVVLSIGYRQFAFSKRFFFQSDYYGALASFATEKHFCAWHLGDLVDLEMKVVEANKIMKLSFFF